MTSVVTERLDAGIARVVMNDATSRNALGEDFRRELVTAFGACIEDADIRALIVATALDDFSVGGNLSKMDDLTDPKAGRARMKSAHRLARLLASSDKPMIAAVKGYAMGAGAGLALACDTIVMGRSATIGFPFHKVGLVPDFAIAYTLARRVGVGRAKQALLYARNYVGEQAGEAGIVDDVVDDDQVDDRAFGLAEELLRLPSHTIALTKRLLDIPAGNLEAALEAEAMAQALCFAGEDFPEGVAAFMEKRKPRFK
ncbi:MAG: enoyl-CoA hydratase/isomerase family protein [Alphaproteobacteria bacterium]|nr:enoyl-CoA hydratase/isomerase family protein [Alphaproteobacteria bacterium]